MRSNDIRKKFLEFFGENDHTVVSSSSLIPEKDPTLLFVNAGIASKVGLCKLIFGRDTLLGFPWSSVDPILIAFPLSFLVAFIVSLATKKTGRPNDTKLLSTAAEK